MPVDPRVPGIAMRPEEKVIFIAKPHWIIFVRLVNILILPLIWQFLGWKNVAYVLTNRRMIVQGGVISLAQRAVEPLKNPRCDLRYVRHSRPDTRCRVCLCGDIWSIKSDRDAGNP